MRNHTISEKESKLDGSVYKFLRCEVSLTLNHFDPQFILDTHIVRQINGLVNFGSSSDLSLYTKLVNMTI